MTETITMSRAELQSICDAAAESAAKKVLADLGLADEHAIHDIRELRTLVQAFRMAKKTAFKTAVRRITDFIFISVLVGIAAKLGFWAGAK
ncbi:MAG: hypothetical protein DI551_00785 [Micavibrio aeruginosavorus]|uniref:Transmembrane protein n=1 Tax=Micavibrio aeruginosavorus TaxID=349221 RepID=A0A2W5N9E0_9BACT|nr:MAG: hypothetical protein DI551_00785 [Micavibrio aeruginosavorus]